MIHIERLRIRLPSCLHREARQLVDDLANALCVHVPDTARHWRRLPTVHVELDSAKGNRATASAAANQILRAIRRGEP